MIMEAIIRGWENFIARPSGPLNLRFIIQPFVGIIIATLAGLKDAKEGRPAYLWALFTNATYRRELLSGGFKDLRVTILISTILDMIYQLIVHKSIYFFELLFTVTLLAIIPYLFLRGPINRVARLFLQKKHLSKKNQTNNHKRR